MRKVLCFIAFVCLLASTSALGGTWEPDDIRVKPFVKARWGQTTHNYRAVDAETNPGILCFNRYTPSNLRSGCAVTAVGMALRWLRFPTRYEWSNMPLNTLSGVSDLETDAIGRLMADLGNVADASYQQEATYVYLWKLAAGLRTGFGFAQADHASFVTRETAYSEKALKDIVIPCCEYGTPVILGVDLADYHLNPDEDVISRHDIVIDGYGYSNGVFCVHARCGDYGESDGWFVPPRFDIGEFKFGAITDVLYNLFPADRGTLVSGTVRHPDGMLAAGVDLLLVDARGDVQSCRSGPNGTYVMKVPCAGACTIAAKHGANTASIGLVVRENVSSDEYGRGGIIGNSCGHDIFLKEPPESDDDVPVVTEGVVRTPEISPEGGEIEGSVLVSISDATDGAEIHYTLDNSAPTVDSPLYVGPFEVSGTVGVRAMAWKAGLAESDEAVAVFTPRVETLPKPTVSVTDADGNDVVVTKAGVCTFSGVATVALSGEVLGMAIHYTTDGSEPTLASPAYAEPLEVSDEMKLRARAWKSGFYTGAEADVSFVYDSKAVVRPGDSYARPMVISGIDGKRIASDVARYTLEAHEAAGCDLWKNSILDGRHLYHTAWFRWIAPGTGRIGFSARCYSPKYDAAHQLVAAVFGGTAEVPSLANRRILVYDDTATQQTCDFSLDVVRGESYFIVMAVHRDLLNGMEGEAKKIVDMTARYELEWTSEELDEGGGEDDSKVDITGSSILLADYVRTFSGLAWTPKVVRVVCQGCVLRPNMDYTCAYLDNVNAGVGKVLVAGCGGFKGMAVGQFGILPRRLTADMVDPLSGGTYSGEEVRPPVTVRLRDQVLKPGIDYDVSYADNVEVGRATVTVTGKGNLKGSVTAGFDIVDNLVVAKGQPMQPKSLQELGVTLDFIPKSVKAEGFPAGLSLKSGSSGFVVSGVPTEPLDGLNRIAYVRVVDDRNESSLWPLTLSVLPDGGASVPIAQVDVSSLRANAVRKLSVMTAGVSVACPVVAEAGTKLTVKGLPKGLKLVQDKSTGSYSLEGVPTATGEVLSVFTAKVGKRSEVFTRAFRVEALPEWAQGTFTGALEGNPLAVTVGKDGKVSVTVTAAGRKLSYSSAGYSSESAGPVFAIRGELAAGKGKPGVAFELTTADWPADYRGVAFENSALLSEGQVVARRNVWKDKTLAAKLSEVAGTYAFASAAGDVLTLTLDEKGAVKVAGRFADGGKASGSATAAVDEGGALTSALTFGKGATATCRWVALDPVHAGSGLAGEVAFRNGAVTGVAASVAGGSGTVTASPKYGQAAVGKTVKLMPKAAKGSTFVKWTWTDPETGEARESTATSLSLTATGADLAVTAVFRSVAATAVPRLVWDREAFAALRVGVAFDETVRALNPADDGDDLVLPVKFTAKNLPAGLKLDAKTGRISGVPTKVSDKPLTIYAVSAVDKKRFSDTETLATGVAALPEWAQGTFTGTLEGDPLAVTVGKDGKVSVTVTAAGRKLSYSSAGYSSEAAGPVFAIRGELAAGKGKPGVAFELTTADWPADYRGVAFENSALLSEGQVVARRNVWKDKTLAAKLSEVAGTYAFASAAGDVLTLTLDEKGAVKVAGRFADGGKASGSATAAVDDDGELTAALTFGKGATATCRWVALDPVHAGSGLAGEVAFRNGAVTGVAASVAGGAGTVTASPKYGQAAVGKTVKLTPKAAKGSTFVKWTWTDPETGEARESTATSLSLTATGADLAVTAVFRSTAVLPE